MQFDVEAIRRQFPILTKKVHGNALTYLDSAATTQKPRCVIDACLKFYEQGNANVHRGVHSLAEESTVEFEKARTIVQKFLNAKKSHEIIFTRNTTESINLVARSFGEMLSEGDVIALSVMEHHSNIVPWMQLSERKKTRLEWIAINKEGAIDEKSLIEVLAKKPKLLAITGMSNVFGTMPDLKKIIGDAHKAGAVVLVDAAQLVGHKKIDVQALDCDFLAFSGHKIYGPLGIGALYGKERLLTSMPPFLSGGGMIENVMTEGFTSAELPRKFEAGTPAAAEAVGLGAAIEWIENIGLEKIEQHEQTLIKHAYEKLQTVPGLHILGNKNQKLKTKNSSHGCISFTVDGIHPHDLTQILGDQGICLRAGHHCCQPLHRFLGINASTRLSVAAYNTIEEIDRCIEVLEQAIRKLS